AARGHHGFGRSRACFTCWPRGSSRRIGRSISRWPSCLGSLPVPAKGYRQVRRLVVKSTECHKPVRGSTRDARTTSAAGGCLLCGTGNRPTEDDGDDQREDRPTHSQPFTVHPLDISS